MNSLFKSWPDRVQLLIDQLRERCNQAMEVESKQPNGPNMEPMEERIMMSATPMAVAADCPEIAADTSGSAQDLVAADDSFFTTMDSVLSVLDPLVGVRANDVSQGTDFTGDVELVRDVEFGSLDLNDDGTFEYTPTGGFQGIDFFTYSIEDAAGNSSTATATIQVLGQVNLASTDEILVNQGIGSLDIANVQDTENSERGSDSAIGIAPNGTSIVVFTDESESVYVRLFDFRGEPIGDQQLVASGNQHSASVAVDGAGNFVVVWVDESGGANESDIYARRFNASGQPLGSEFLVTDGVNQSGSQIDPDIAINDAGQFVIGWSGAGEGDQSGIFGRIYNTDGSDSGVFRANDDPAGVQNIPSVGIDDAGNAVFGWSDQANNNVQVRRFDSSGTPLTVERDGPTQAQEVVGPFVFDIDIEIENLSLSVRGDGHVAIALTSYAEIDPNNLTVALVALNPDLSSSLIYTDVNQSSLGVQQDPSVTFLDNGEVLVVWEGRSANDASGVFARRFALNFTDQVDPTELTPVFVPTSNERQINQTIPGVQSSASVAALDANNFAVVWNGNGVDDTNGVFLRQFGGVFTFANDDIFVGTENQDVTIQIADLFDNDFDGTGSGLSLESFSNPANGTVVDNGDGTLTYTPGLNYNGTDSFIYTVRSGNQTASANVRLAIESVNNAPVLDPTSPFRFFDVVEDEAAPFGTRVFNLLQNGGFGAATDADETNPLLGIAVTGFDSTNGKWQYSTDNGASYQDFGVVSDQSATLLASDSLVRFVPAENYFGTDNSFTFRAWDQTEGSNGQTGFDIVDLGSPTSAFSEKSATAEQIIVAQNDRPFLIQTPETVTVDEDSATVIVDLLGLIGDVEDTEFTYTVTGNSNNGLVVNPTIVNDSQLSLSFFPDRVGTATIFLLATDSGSGSAGPESRDFQIPVVVLASNDSPTGDVFVNGILTEFQTLNATNSISDTDGLGLISYQWQRDGVDIAGATLANYMLGADDIGSDISVVASYTDGGGTLEEVRSASVGPVIGFNDPTTGTVTISGDPIEDQTLTVSNTLADLDGIVGAISYQWQRNGTDIPGANGTSYTLGDDDVNATISVVATYTDGLGNLESAASNFVGPVANINDLPVGTVTITGNAVEDQTLTASHNLTDADGLGVIGYQWLRDGVAIANATNDSYTLDDADVGSQITVNASYFDNFGTSESVDSLATGAVENVNDLPVGNGMIFGAPVEDQTISASLAGVTDADGIGLVIFQWQRDGVDIPGATEGQYTLGDADVGTTISFIATYTDFQGTTENVRSLDFGPIQNINDLPTGTVDISGIATEDETLTVTNTLVDLDGLGTISYQWQRNGQDIAGATGDSYTLGDDDVNAMISVVATYTDGFGAMERVSSASVGPVVNVNDLPTGEVTISGTAAENSTLLATHNLADIEGLGSITFQWQRDGVDIAGANGSQYVLQADDIGSEITVVASYNDGLGTAESVSSLPFGPIANVNDTPVGFVNINGVATEDETLTATNNLTDLDGLGTIGYQWQRDGVNITGATNDTYTLGDDDVNAVITVIASYTDGFGFEESVTSAGVGPVANVNDLPTGTVDVFGTAFENSTLTASNSLADDDGIAPISYQWQNNGVDIAGATGSTYVLQASDIGDSITVVATYTDGQGTAESVGSVAIGPIANVNDVPTGTVTISGDATEDQTLTASNDLADFDGLGTITYQWQRDGVDIAGATGDTYTLGDSDVGSTITVVATYTDGFDTVESVTSASVGPVANVNDLPTGTVDIVGAAFENSTLTAGNTLGDIDGIAPISYQWQNNGVDIAGATGSTYVLQASDIGDSITVVATYTDGQGTDEAVSSSVLGPVQNVNDAPVGSVAIAGTPTEDETLTASNDLTDFDGLGTITYQWQRDGVNIGGATTDSYTLGDSDVGSVISVVATYTDGFGTVESVTSSNVGPIANVNDLPVGVVSITGVATEGEILTASNDLSDDDGLGTISYQWQRNGVDIAGATNSTYELGDLDAGQEISVVASYTDGHGTVESVDSVEVGPIVNDNDGPLGAVNILGDVTEDQTLTATNNLTDADGIGVITYQWQRDGVDIAGETSDSYTLGDDDVGSLITVVASYTDGFGTVETETSDVVGPVANVNDLPTGNVTVFGTAVEHNLLTAVNDLADDDGLGTITYQWQRDGVDIAGATNDTYLLAFDDIGSEITVVASYTDGNGTLESVSSSILGPVLNFNDAPVGTVDVAGTPTEDETLIATNNLTDNDVLGTIAYQWQRDGVDISGATGSTYTLGDDDVNSVITVTASYTDGFGFDESVTSSTLGPVANVNDAPVGLVNITGNATENETLTASNNLTDDDGLGTISYQWQRNGVDITGATSDSYTLGNDDVNALITVVASYTDGQGTAESVSSVATGPVANINDALTGSVNIVGNAVEDQTLTATNDLSDADGLGIISYQWQRDGVDIAGATSDTYTLGDSDVGSEITVVASYTDGFGTVESVVSQAVGPVLNVNDAPTGSVTISGTPAETETLTASNSLQDVEGLGTISYQWQRDGVNIAGATGSTYDVLESDAGSLITVVASYTDGLGTDEAVSSAAVGPIVNLNLTPELSITNVITQLVENSADSSAIQVAEIVISDDMDGINSLSLAGSDAGLFEIVGDQLFVRSGAELDFESQSSFDITVQLDDAAIGTGLEDSVDYSLNLTDLNETPFTTSDTPLEIITNEDSTGLSIDLNELFDDQDFADSQLDFSFFEDTTWLRAAISPDNQLLIGLAADQSGTSQLLVRATDHEGLIAETTVNLVVTPQNDTVDIADQEFRSFSGEVIQGNLLDTNQDADGETLSIVVVEEPENGLLTVFGDGSFEFVPEDGFDGEVSFRVVADDGVAVSNEANIVIVQALDLSTVVIETTPTPVVVEAIALEEAVVEAESEIDQSASDGDDGLVIGNTAAATAINSTSPANSNSGQSESNDVGASGEELNAVNPQIVRSEAEAVGNVEFLIDRIARGVSQASVNEFTSELAFQASSFAAANSSTLVALLQQSGDLWEELDAFQETTDAQAAFETIAIGSVGTVSSSLIVGYVVWALRSGLLLSSVVASMPVWNILDPLAVVSVADAGLGDDSESLEDIVDGSNSDNDD